MPAALWTNPRRLIKEILCSSKNRGYDLDHLKQSYKGKVSCSLRTCFTARILLSCLNIWAEGNCGVVWQTVSLLEFPWTVCFWDCILSVLTWEGISCLPYMWYLWLLLVVQYKVSKHISHQHTPPHKGNNPCSADTRIAWCNLHEDSKHKSTDDSCILWLLDWYLSHQRKSRTQCLGVLRKKKKKEVVSSCLIYWIIKLQDLSCFSGTWCCLRMFA